jgi:hypothetical protein
MSLFGIGSSTPAATAGNTVQAQQTTAIGGGALNAAFPGAQMAQPDGGSILKKMLVGGIAGAGLGAGYGLIAGALSFLPPFMVVGPAMGALIGGIAGAGMGLIKGLLDKRNANLALQKQADVNPPVQIVKPLPGKTYKAGAKGSQVKWTQNALKKMGLYTGKVTSKLDAKTAKAIRRYELMKGAMPTGTSTPDLRAALQQDIKLSAQFI